MNKTKTVLTQLLAVLLVFQCAAAEASASKPHQDTSQWIGSNYTPAYCSNQVQMWHDFRPEVIDRELAAARKYFGINTLRVYLHYIVYQHEKDELLARIEQFLSICAKHNIRPGFVFFDDCWNRMVRRRSRPANHRPARTRNNSGVAMKFRASVGA